MTWYISRALAEDYLTSSLDPEFRAALKLFPEDQQHTMISVLASCGEHMIQEIKDRPADVSWKDVCEELLAFRKRCEFVRAQRDYRTLVSGREIELSQIESAYEEAVKKEDSK